jgi:hypothetical protein
LGAFFRAKPEKTGLSAPSPPLAASGVQAPGFPLQSLALSQELAGPPLGASASSTSAPIGKHLRQMPFRGGAQGFCEAKTSNRKIKKNGKAAGRGTREALIKLRIERGKIHERFPRKYEEEEKSSPQ